MQLSVFRCQREKIHIRHPVQNYIFLFQTVITINQVFVASFSEVLYAVIPSVNKQYRRLIGHVFEINSVLEYGNSESVAHLSTAVVVARITQQDVFVQLAGFADREKVVVQVIVSELCPGLNFQGFESVGSGPASCNGNIELLIDLQYSAGIDQFEIGGP